MLFELQDGSYMIVGESVKTFKIPHGDTIRKYVSPVGNNDVPYPYAVGDKYTYLLIENVRIANELLVEADDPYDFFYINRSKKISGVQRQAVRVICVFD